MYDMYCIQICFYSVYIYIYVCICIYTYTCVYTYTMHAYIHIHAYVKKGDYTFPLHWQQPL